MKTFFMDDRVEFPPQVYRQLKILYCLEGVHDNNEDICEIGKECEKDIHKSVRSSEFKVRSFVMNRLRTNHSELKTGA